MYQSQSAGKYLACMCTFSSAQSNMHSGMDMEDDLRQLLEVLEVWKI